MSEKEIDKGIVYSNRVLLGNWFEASKLEEFKINNFLEQMKNGELLLARYRTMTKNLNEPTIVTQSTGNISFGSRIMLIAPHVPATDPPIENKKGLTLGGRISANEIEYYQELVNGCSLVGLVQLEPAKRNTFVITSADYCKRDGETLKYNQEFLLTLASSLNKKPLYVRYDPNPIPGLCGLYPLYLSEHAVSNTRWRFLPIQRSDITRFEQEGQPVQDIMLKDEQNQAPDVNPVRSCQIRDTHVHNNTFEMLFLCPVNTDLIINHCSTNVNMAINVGKWAMGFHGKVCTLVMKTCLDVYGKELPNNIFQIYVPISS